MLTIPSIIIGESLYKRLFTCFRIEFHSGMKRKSTRVYMENVSLGLKFETRVKPEMTMVINNILASLITRAICGSTSLGFGSVFFILSAISALCA